MSGEKKTLELDIELIEEPPEKEKRGRKCHEER